MTDYGTDALIQHWRHRRAQQFAAAVGSTSVTIPLTGVSATASAGSLDVQPGELVATGHAPTVVVTFPEILVGATLLDTGGKTPDGDIVIAVTPVFRRFLKELARDPNALYQLNSRQFEELIAGGYEEDGCEVVITPQSGDKGRDVIATSTKWGTVKIIDQVKLFAPHRVVDANDVRALYGVLTLDQSASKGIVTTSSRFAPGVPDEFKPLVPGRLSFRNGNDVRTWLHEFDKP